MFLKLTKNAGHFFQKGTKGKKRYFPPESSNVDTYGRKTAEPEKRPRFPRGHVTRGCAAVRISVAGPSATYTLYPLMRQGDTRPPHSQLLGASICVKRTRARSSVPDSDARNDSVRLILLLPPSDRDASVWVGLWPRIDGLTQHCRLPSQTTARHVGCTSFRWEVRQRCQWRGGYLMLCSRNVENGRT